MKAILRNLPRPVYLALFPNVLLFLGVFWDGSAHEPGIGDYLLVLTLAIGRALRFVTYPVGLCFAGVQAARGRRDALVMLAPCVLVELGDVWVLSTLWGFERINRTYDHLEHSPFSNWLTTAGSLALVVTVGLGIARVARRVRHDAMEVPDLNGSR